MGDGKRLNRPDVQWVLRCLTAVLAVVAVLAVGGPTAAAEAPRALASFSYDATPEAVGDLLAAKQSEQGRVVASPLGACVADSSSRTTTRVRLGRELSAPQTAIGFTDDAVGSAYQGMRSGGGHAMRHLVDEGLIPNSVVLFVAKEGPYKGRVISAIVPDANQIAQWGL